MTNQTKPDEQDVAYFEKFRRIRNITPMHLAEIAEIVNDEYAAPFKDGDLIASKHDGAKDHIAARLHKALLDRGFDASVDASVMKGVLIHLPQLHADQLRELLDDNN